MNAEYHHKMLWTICIHCDTQKIRLCVSSLMKTTKNTFLPSEPSAVLGPVQSSTDPVLYWTVLDTFLLYWTAFNPVHSTDPVQYNPVSNTVQFSENPVHSTDYPIQYTSSTVHSSTQYRSSILVLQYALLDPTLAQWKLRSLMSWPLCIHWNIQKPWPPKPQKHVSTIRIQPNPRMAMIGDHYHRMSSRLSIHDTMQNTQFAKRWHIANL